MSCYAAVSAAADFITVMVCEWNMTHWRYQSFRDTADWVPASGYALHVVALPRLPILVIGQLGSGGPVLQLHSTSHIIGAML